MKIIKRKKGFTLIELIVVLAVMAIISLIAIPNFKAVRENSKIKADNQTKEIIKRAVNIMIAEGEIPKTGQNGGEYWVVFDYVDGKIKESTCRCNYNQEDPKDCQIHMKVYDTLKDMGGPQAKYGTVKRDYKNPNENDKLKGNCIIIKIEDGSIKEVEYCHALPS